MKILSLKALNINSLKGETAIDFEKLTKQSALFCITGPTGSGKSTLLDIISCALYGRTSRLKNPNDLMSRHCGEAYCEVVFEIKDKRYRSSWAQKRAHNRYDGKFQTAKMQLVDLDEDKILDLKSREVPKKIEELSGLDFARFTQSMLLAQGGFDAFLKADEKERSTLLEKITGTQIYAAISMAIFEKHRVLQQEIKTEQKVLDSIELLAPEIIEGKQKELDAILNEKKESDKRFDQLDKEYNWKVKLLELTEESETYTTLYEEVKKEKEAHKERYEKLALAIRADNIFATFSAHETLQKTIRSDKTTLTQFTQELSDLEKELEEKNREYAHIYEEYVLGSENFKKESHKLQEARKLETQAQEIQKQNENEKKVREHQKETLLVTQKHLQEIHEEYEQLEKEIAQKKSYRATNIEDEKLLTTLPLIEQNMQVYKKEHALLGETQSQLVTLKKSMQQEEEKYYLQKEQVELLERALKEKEKHYSVYEQKCRDDITLQESLEKDLDDTQLLLRTLQEYMQLLEEKTQLNEEYEKNSELINSLLQIEDISKNHINAIKKHVQTLREKQAQEQLLQKYEEDRKKLHEGEACFLCGSTKHPYATHSQEISIDKTKEMLKEQVELLDEKEQELRKLELQLSALQTEEKNTQLAMEKIDNSMDQCTTIFQKNHFEFSTDALQNLEDNEKELILKLDEVKKNRIVKDKLLKEKEQAFRAFESENKVYNDQKGIVEKLRSDKEHLVSTIIAHQEKLTEIQTHLAMQITQFIPDFIFASIELHLKELHQRDKAYIQNREELKLLQKKLETVIVEKRESETKLSMLTEELENAKKKQLQLEISLKALADKKIEILNIVNLDRYEKEITDTYKNLQEKEQSSKAIVQTLEVQKEERLKNRQRLITKISEDEKSLISLQNRLEVLYKENDFEGAQQFHEALLEEAQRKELQTFCQNLDDKYKHIEALYLQTSAKLTEHQKESLSDKSLQDIETLQALLKQKVEALQESIGSAKKELQLYRENSEKYHKRMDKLEQKKESFKVWVKLNELVGSADGAKFKKYAQGITLDQLIRLANRHLNILNRRYTLARNQEKILDLEVIDAYQGDVVRSVATLSGGESFIVSLALALGLSELASQKIAIDSLFLDEGFGTLDEESLETALNALNLLQDGGKMVGVISHVEALKERIPLQIKIAPNGDGTSFVEIIS